MERSRDPRRAWQHGVVSEAVHAYSYWLYRLWVGLLAIEIVAIAAATKAPCVLTTSKGPTMSGYQEEA